MDFDANDHGTTGANSNDAGDAPRLIVVQYRRNWWTSLLPPLLLVALAVGVIKFRVEQVDWSPSWVKTPTTPAAPSVVDVIPSPNPTPIGEPTPVPTPPPEVAPVRADPPEETEIAAAEEILPAESPTVDAEIVSAKLPAGRPFDMTEATDGEVSADPSMPDREPPAATLPPPLASNAEEEARRIREERDALSRMKDDLLEADHRRTEKKKVDEVIHAVRRNTESRDEFLRDLRSLLTTHGRNAGQEIAALCNRYGRQVPNRSIDIARDFFKRSVGVRMDARQRVDYLRSLAFPESMILEDLASEQEKHLGRRGGPRNRDEAMVAAAKQLLNVPVGDPKPPRGMTVPIASERPTPAPPNR